VLVILVSAGSTAEDERHGGVIDENTQAQTGRAAARRWMPGIPRPTDSYIPVANSQRRLHSLQVASPGAKIDRTRFTGRPHSVCLRLAKRPVGAMCRVCDSDREAHARRL